ncbi:MAG TPA: lysophospholipid acyltransferase family protein [Gemmatimonadales bacterium]|nr:lysophospholipid acyltransferase family protein [Gemmatimonadales bacterium]
MRAFPPPGPPSPPTPIAQWLFERYIRRQAARHFAGVHWALRGMPAGWDRSVPTLFVANHTNWWDGFLAFLVGRALGFTFQVLMEARHLARYRVFLRVGALPLRRGRAKDAYADLVAAAEYLRPGSGLWMFPQGERRPPAEPPVNCERGAAHLVLGHGGPLRICPVAFRYAFLGEQLPEAFVLVGEEWLPRREAFGGRAPLMRAIEARLIEAVDGLDRLVADERLEAFQPLAAGRLSVNKRLDRARHAVGLLRGPFEVRNG